MIPPIKVVSDEEAEQCSMVVCVRESVPAVFADDVIVPCAHGCGHNVRHRPHAPKTPPKVCMECMLEQVNGGTA